MSPETCKSLQVLTDAVQALSEQALEHAKQIDAIRESLIASYGLISDLREKYETRH